VTVKSLRCGAFLPNCCPKASLASLIASSTTTFISASSGPSTRILNPSILVPGFLVDSSVVLSKTKFVVGYLARKLFI